MTRHGVPEPLGPRGVAVLAVLLATPGALVTKRSLLKTAWPGIVVEDSNLTVQISAIRRMLGQVPGGDRWIETIPRRGYRFTGPVVETPAPDATPGRATAPSNLPAALTAFIGRERELIELERLIAGARLLTIVGTGGIGKTRLALQLAGRLKDRHRDGVCFVDLGPLAEGAMVAQAVARALDLHPSGSESPQEALVAFVKWRRLLLVLDNCEHLLDACAQLAHLLLRASPEPTILATSREALGADGEQLYRLQPLAIPPSQATLQVALGAEAVRLFVDRARLQDPHFQVDESAAAVLVRLCTRLEGMPLALELAAAQAGSLGVSEIDARLADRLGTLVGTSRTAPARQRSLRAALDWSYDRLAPTEQRLWRQLAVFAGGYTREAALAVMDAGPGATEALDRLVARSLVNAGRGEGGQRFGLFETMRDYAMERLRQAGELEAARQRHASLYRSLAVQASDEWLATSETHWRARYLPEIDNVRAALDWALQPGGDPALAVSLAGASGPWFRDRPQEALARLRGVSHRLHPGIDATDAARLWFWLGTLQEPEPAQAVSCFERALPVLRRAGPSAALAFALVWSARAQASLGALGPARESLAEALPLVRACALPRLWGYYHDQDSFVRLQHGDLAGAESSQAAALAAQRDAGNEDAVLASLVNLGNIAWASANLEVAASSFREVVEKRRRARVQRPGRLAFALANLAGVLTECGDLDQAADAIREAAPTLVQVDRLWIFVDHFALHAALACRPRPAALLVGWADAQRAARQAPREANEARARARTGELLARQLGVDELDALRREGASLAPAEVFRVLPGAERS